MSKFLKHVNQVPRRPRAVARKGLWKVAPAGWITGWIFSGLAVLFILCFGLLQYLNRPQSMFPDFWIDRNPASGMGTVTRNTHFSTGKGSSLTRFAFEFETEFGAYYAGFSYARGRSKLQAGDKTPVTYDADNPNLARIEGTRAGRFHYYLFIFLLLFGAVGAFVLWRANKKRGGLLQVLATGEPVQGVVTRAVHMRTMKVNNIRPWKIHYSFQRLGGKSTDGFCYIFPKSNKDPAPANAGDPCVVLYNEDNPALNAVVYEGDFSIMV